MKRMSIHDFHARLVRGDGSLPATYAALARRARPDTAGAALADWPIWTVPEGDGTAVQAAAGWIPWGAAARTAGWGDWTVPPTATRAG